MLGGALPFVASARERLHAALGAAMALRAIKSQGVVVAYVKHGECGREGLEGCAFSGFAAGFADNFVGAAASEKRGKSSERATVS